MPRTGSKGLIKTKKCVWKGQASLFPTLQEPPRFFMDQEFTDLLFLSKVNLQSPPHPRGTCASKGGHEVAAERL